VLLSQFISYCVGLFLGRYRLDRNGLNIAHLSTFIRIRSSSNQRSKDSETMGNLDKQEIKKLEQYQNWEIERRDYNEILKGLPNQQIEINLDDGVAVNYPKFEGAVAEIS